MESPLDNYKYLLKFNDIEKIANDVLFEKYIIQNKVGIQKKIDISDTDQESLINRLNGGYPIPGLIYTFIYKPTPEEINIVMSGKKQERYTDHVPLVFCVNINGKTFSGINLNVLPLSERLKFLQLYYETYKSFFDDIERTTQNNVVTINKKFISIILSNNGQKIVKMWSDKANSNFGYGYRNYSIEKIDRFRMIEFNEYSYIPFFKSENATKLMHINKVHNLYWKNS